MSSAARGSNRRHVPSRRQDECEVNGAEGRRRRCRQAGGCAEESSRPRETRTVSSPSLSGQAIAASPESPRLLPQAVSGGARFLTLPTSSLAGGVSVVAGLHGDAYSPLATSRAAG